MRITGNYQLSIEDKELIIDSTRGAFTLTLPDNYSPFWTCKLLFVGADINNVTIDTNGKLLNGSGSALIISNENATVTLFLQKIEEGVVYIIASNNAGGGGVYAGWTLASPNLTRLNDAIGITVEVIDIVGTEFTPFAIIDNSALGDIIIDITPLDTINNLIKTFSTKLNGVGSAGNLRIQSTIGFSDGSFEFLCSSCTLINDGTKWIILSYEPAILQLIYGDGSILAMGTNPLPLLDEPAFGTYWNIEEIRIEFGAGVTAYNTTALELQIKAGSIYLFGIPIDFIEGAENKYFIIKDFTKTISMSDLKALTITTDDASDPTLGTGTLTFWIKYEEKIFNI